jgi:ketosteroid isomerase-like protein
MQKLRSFFAIVLVLATIAALPASSRAQGDKGAINSLYDQFVKAFNKADVNDLMAVYSPDVFVFDLAPPREYPTRAAYKKDWQDLFDAFPGPITVSLSELNITVAGSVAYTHCINDATLTAKDGSKTHLVARVTDVLRKQNGKWLIVLEHVSVPVDPVTGKSDLLSKP